jgi:hypothetical protein
MWPTSAQQHADKMRARIRRRGPRPRKPKALRSSEGKYDELYRIIARMMPVSTLGGREFFVSR